MRDTRIANLTSWVALSTAGRRRLDAGHGRFGADEKVGRRGHALILGGHPDRLPAVPAAVLHIGPVPEGVSPSLFPVNETAMEMFCSM